MLKVTKAKRIQSLQRMTRFKLKRWHVFDWMRKNVCFKCRSRKHSGHCYGVTPDNDDSEEEIPICTDCGNSQDECMCHYGEYERDHECTWCHGREGGCMYCADYSDDDDSERYGPSYIGHLSFNCVTCKRKFVFRDGYTRDFCTRTCFNKHEAMYNGYHDVFKY